MALPTMLPTSLREKRAPPAKSYLRFMARRYLVFTVVGIALLTLAGRVYWPHARPYRSSDTSSRNPLAQHPPLPPLYEAYHEAELRLPQHHWEQRRPREEKFLFVAGHSRSTLVVLYRCGSCHTDCRFLQVADGETPCRSYF